MKKLLFVSHEATLNGAPLVGFRIAKFLSQNFDLTLIYLLGGPLLKSRSHPFQVIHFNIKPKSHLRNIFYKLLNREYVSTYDKEKKIIACNPDLILLNSIGSLPFLNFINKLSCKKVVFIHELPYAIINYFISIGEELKILKQFDLIIVVNPITKQFLFNEIQIPSEKICVIEPCIDDEFYLMNSDTPSEIKFDILFSGYGGWTKGTDLLPQVLNELNRLSPNKSFKLAWIGHVDIITQNQVKYDMQQLKLNAYHLEFMGVQSDVKSILAKSRLFISLSRSDAFSTACIEAMAMGIPVLCFKNTGGIADLLEKEFNLDIEYLDLKKMSNKILHLLQSHEEYEICSKKSVQIASIYKINIKGKEIMDNLISVLNSI